MARVSRSPLQFRFKAVGARVLRSPIFTGQLEAELLAYTRAHAREVLETVREYPPQDPNSRYVRTYTDFDSWRIVGFSEGGGTGYRVVNDAADPRGRLYSRYLHGPGVQPDGYQSRGMRFRGWLNVSDYMNRPGFREGAQAILLRAIAATR